MDVAARTLLQGLREAPITTCTCAKGIAAGLRIAQHCLPDFLVPTGHSAAPSLAAPADAFKGLPLGRQAADMQHRPSASWGAKSVQHDAAVGQPRDELVGIAPDSNRAATGLVGAHEACYLALLAAHDQ